MGQTLSSDYYIGELDKQIVDKTDDAKTTNAVPMVHPHTQGPIALVIQIKDKRNRQRFKARFNRLRDSSIQMIDFWTKECLKRQRLENSQNEQQKIMQRELKKFVHLQTNEKNKK